MLLEMAVGDAYGAAFEYADPNVTRKNDLSMYRWHPRHPIIPGRYTDDTQMSIAIAEAMLSGKDWNRENLAAKFVDVFHRDQREGYAASFHELLKTTYDSMEFLHKIKPDSDKSGAAMRAPPIGFFPSAAEVLEKTELQARITHNTPEGIHSAQAAALMTHYFLYNHGVKKYLPEFIQQYVPGQWTIPWLGKVGPKGSMSVRAAITALARCECMSQLLIECVAYTGDVDTVAALAMAGGACCSEIRQDLPQLLIDKLENGRYGRGFIVELDRSLCDHFKIHKTEVRGSMTEGAK